MKFTLIANDQQQDGFKLSVSAENDKELEVVQELTKLLIEKITKIEVAVTNYEG